MEQEPGAEPSPWSRGCCTSGPSTQRRPDGVDGHRPLVGTMEYQLMVGLEFMVGYCNWGWQRSSSSSSTTTTLPVGDEFLPNQAFFPIIQPIDEEHSWLIHLTGAERRMLQENGVQGPVVERIDALLLQMDDFAATELGPEARWGLARLVRRADEGMVALQCILDVLLRRLRPRGTRPVIRTPRREVDQLRHFQRARNYGSMFEDTLAHHLNVPLQPREDGPNVDSSPDHMEISARPQRRRKEMVRRRPPRRLLIRTQTGRGTAQDRGDAQQMQMQRLEWIAQDSRKDACLPRPLPFLRRYRGHWTVSSWESGWNKRGWLHPRRRRPVWPSPRRLPGQPLGVLLH